MGIIRIGFISLSKEEFASFAAAKCRAGFESDLRPVKVIRGMKDSGAQRHQAAAGSENSLPKTQHRLLKSMFR